MSNTVIVLAVLIVLACASTFGAWLQSALAQVSSEPARDALRHLDAP